MEHFDPNNKPSFLEEFDTINTVLLGVSSDKHTHVSYVFGTHHAFGSNFFDSLEIAY